MAPVAPVALRGNAAICSTSARPRALLHTKNCRGDSMRIVGERGARVRLPAALSDPQHEEAAVDPVTAFLHVEDVMTTSELRTCSPDESLADVLPRLSHVHGLPVVTSDGTVVGVVSRKDVEALRGDYRAASVSAAMRSPAVTIRDRAHVSDAAALMLAHGIHRLPVVDARGRLSGIITRSDVEGGMDYAANTSSLLDFATGRDVSFRSLMTLDEEAWRAEERGRGGAAPAPTLAPAAQVAGAWGLTYLYDGECSMCRNLKGALQQADRQGRLRFVDIAGPDYRPEDHGGVSWERAMEKIHVVKRDGGVLAGAAALEALYGAVGWGWMWRSAQAVPGLGWVAERTVDLVSALRLPLSGKALGALAAMRRARQEQRGDTGCHHGPDEECEAPLDFDDVPSLEDVARMEREKGEREKGRGTERL